MNNRILVINTGSSSLKLGVYSRGEEDEQRVFEGLADGIGTENGSLTLRGEDDRILRSEALHSANEQDALAEAVNWLREISPEAPAAIGHRVVHGGPRLTEHQEITPEVIKELQACVHFAPIHIPVALALIAAAQKLFPDIRQFACFDTAFHRTLPAAAARFPLKKALFDQGIRRYGFHGLSYESIVYRLAHELPARTVIAHLGSGASLAAVQAGVSVDTTMGLTPTGGIPMGTRSGDLDPGLMLFLLRNEAHDADALEKMLNGDAGLKAISGGESDMRALEKAAKAGDGNAELAITIFCAAISKVVGAYATVLGGLDLLVFTGGIGEHSARVREEVCRRLQFLGVTLDAARNEAGDLGSSVATGQVGVRVLESEEDRQIARHCRTLARV